MFRGAVRLSPVGQRDPFSVDPTLVERALRSHATTQNALATFLVSHGLQPLSPSPHEPNFDLAWVHDSITWVAEIKSLSESNEEKQLRLGLGQLLRYRQILRVRGNIQAILVVERQPVDKDWALLSESNYACCTTAPVESHHHQPDDLPRQAVHSRLALSR